MRNITDNTPPPPEPVPQRRPIGRPPREESAAKATAQPKPAAAGQDAAPVTTQTKAPEPAQPVKAVSIQTKAAEPVPQFTVAPAVNVSTPFRPVKSVYEEKSKATDQMGLFGAEVDLINKINVLQQQLSSSQEREKHLRRQLNDSELRFQKEQQKTRALQS